MTTILIALLFSLVFNLLMFIPASIWKTDKLTDLSYCITFIAISVWLLATNQPSLITTILILMICVWAIRLGTFLYIRIRKQTKDNRFDGMREDFFKFLKFWILQGVSVWIIMMPIILFFQNPNTTQNKTSIFFIAVGFVIWLIGLLIESFADFQKYVFKQNPENKEKWIATGLWKKTRHPNYLGEITLWIGVYIFAFSFLTDGQSAVALISPLFIFILLKYISGVPLLEKSADAKWGQNPEYTTYKTKSGIILPKL